MVVSNEVSIARTCHVWQYSQFDDVVVGEIVKTEGGEDDFAVPLPTSSIHDDTNIVGAVGTTTTPTISAPNNNQDVSCLFRVTYLDKKSLEDVSKGLELSPDGRRQEGR
jgi:hypothetical protein